MIVLVLVVAVRAIKPRSLGARVKVAPARFELYVVPFYEIPIVKERFSAPVASRPKMKLARLRNVVVPWGVREAGLLHVDKLERGAIVPASLRVSDQTACLFLGKPDFVHDYAVN